MRSLSDAPELGQLHPVVDARGLAVVGDDERADPRPVGARRSPRTSVRYSSPWALSVVEPAERVAQQRRPSNA